MSKTFIRRKCHEQTHSFDRRVAQLFSRRTSGARRLATNIKTPDTHSAEAKGKVALYRVQVQGLEFGKDTHKADAEVLVSLDSAPDDVYVLRLHENSPPINKVMADTLRDAVLNSPMSRYNSR